MEAQLLPILLSTESLNVGLAGAGEGRARRAALLAEAGITPAPVDEKGALPDIGVLFVAGLAPSAAGVLAGRARDAGILVNVEDVPELCDFHVPAIVRRGDLVLTASTGGRAPGLARRLREWLEGRFGPEWSSHMEEVSQSRSAWRADGLSAHDVSDRTRALIAEKGWLQ
jgi:precorrin-2 dehydrogenase/sirohydrochlorin ferrochelatase